jgi:hypothetical protein
MADNTLLNVGIAGDVIRTLDKTGTGNPKTEVVALDLGGGDGRSEQISGFPIPASLPDVPVDDDGVPLSSWSPSTMDWFETLMRQTMAQTGFPQINAEVLAGVVPVNPGWPPGVDLRYGVIRDNATDNTTTLQNMINVCSQTNGPIGQLTGGTAVHSGTLNWGFSRLNVVSANDSFLRYTGGVGPANTIDGGAATTFIDNVFLDGVYELGGPNATYCWDIRSCHRSKVRLYAKNCTLSGFRWRFGVLNHMELMCSQNDSQGNFTTTPVNGVIFDVRAAGEYIAWTYPSTLHMGGVSGTGWVFQTSTGTAGPKGGVYSGSSEGNGSGISTDANTANITFLDVDCEANTSASAGCDWNLQGQFHQLINTQSISSAATDSTTLSNSAQILFKGGYHRSVAVQSTAIDTFFDSLATSDNASLGIHGAGTWRQINVVKYNTAAPPVATNHPPDIYGPASTFTQANRDVLTLNGVTDIVYDNQIGGTSQAYFYIASNLLQIQCQGGPIQLLPGNANKFSISTAGDITARGVSICLRATSIETRSSTTTLTNSTQLAFVIPGAGTYAFECVVFSYFTTAVTDGITANINFSGTFTAVGSYVYGDLMNGTVTTTGIQPVEISATVNNALAGLTMATYGASVAAATPAVHFLKGNLIATATGTLAFAFAQSTSGVDTSNLGVGSWMTVTQLS